MATDQHQRFLAYHRRSVVFGTTVLYTCLFATGIFALASDADRIRHVESRAAVVSVGVLALAVSTWEGAKWIARLIRGSSGIRIVGGILVVDLTHRLRWTSRAPLADIRSVSPTDRALIIRTTKRKVEIPIQPYEDPGRETVDRVSGDIRSRIPT